MLILLKKNRGIVAASRRYCVGTVIMNRAHHTLLLFLFSLLSDLKLKKLLCGLLFDEVFPVLSGCAGPPGYTEGP